MIAGVRFTVDGKGVITAGMDRRVLRWDTLTGRQTVVGTRLPRSRSWNTHLGPDGARALEEGSVYDPATGEELFALPGEYAVPSADFRRAAGFHGPHGLKADSTWCEVWDLESRQRLVRLTSPATNFWGVQAAFSPDNSRLVTAAAISPQKLGDPMPLVVTGWEATTGKKLGELRETGPNIFRQRMDDGSTHAAVGDNSRVVLATADGKLWVADYEKGARGETLGELTRPKQRFTLPTFSPDGKLLAVGLPVENSHEFGVRIYSWPSGKLLHTFTGHRGPVTALAFSPDGKTLASGSADGTVLVWDLTTIAAPK